MDTQILGSDYDVLAPDGSEIRLLPQTARGSMVHCTLQPGQTSKAVKHRTVEEIWYVPDGRGEIWRKQGVDEKIVGVEPDTSITIRTGAHFQFRNTGEKPFEAIIVTMPPWPGDHEAEIVEGKWAGSE